MKHHKRGAGPFGPAADLRAPSDRGIALVVVLMAIVFLTALGTVLVLTTSTETLVAANFRNAQQGLYAADAMAERAMHDLESVGDWNTLLSGGAASAFVDGPPSGTRHLDDGSTIELTEIVNQADCQQAAACTVSQMNAVTDDRPWGPNNPRWRLFAYGPLRNMLPSGSLDTPWYVVAMTGDDPAETDNDPTRDGATGSPGAGVLALRAEAFGPVGAHRVVELTVARNTTGGVRLLSWRELR